MTQAQKRARSVTPYERGSARKDCQLDAIARMPLLGEQVAVATSVVTGPHQWLALLAAVLFPVFIVDVIATL